MRHRRGRRTEAGVEAEDAGRGRREERPSGAIDLEWSEIIRIVRVNSRLSARQVAKQLGVHRVTLYRSLAAR